MSQTAPSGSTRVFAVDHRPYRNQMGTVQTVTFVEAPDALAARQRAERAGRLTVSSGVNAPPVAPGYAFGIAPTGTTVAPAPQSPLSTAGTVHAARVGSPRGPHKLRPHDACWWMYTEGGGGGAGDAPNPVVPVKAIYLGLSRSGRKVRVRHADKDTDRGTFGKESWVSASKVFPRAFHRRGK